MGVLKKMLSPFLGPFFPEAAKKRGLRYFHLSRAHLGTSHFAGYALVAEFTSEIDQNIAQEFASALEARMNRSGILGRLTVREIEVDRNTLSLVILNTGREKPLPGLRDFGLNSVNGTAALVVTAESGDLNGFLLWTDSLAVSFGYRLSPIPHRLDLEDGLYKAGWEAI